MFFIEKLTLRNWEMGRQTIDRILSYILKISFFKKFSSSRGNAHFFIQRFSTKIGDPEFFFPRYNVQNLFRLIYPQLSKHPNPCVHLLHIIGVSSEKLTQEIPKYYSETSFSLFWWNAPSKISRWLWRKSLKLAEFHFSGGFRSFSAGWSLQYPLELLTRISGEIHFSAIGHFAPKVPYAQYIQCCWIT